MQTLKAVSAFARADQEINFFKNIGVVAGLLFYSVSGPEAWSIVGWKAGEPRAQEPKTA